jgi:hypothetical protein
LGDLIKEAKAFKRWANTQKNPKFYRNGAHFINWLKRRKYGSNEKEVMDTFVVTNKELLSVVKKHVI